MRGRAAGLRRSIFNAVIIQTLHNISQDYDQKATLLQEFAEWFSCAGLKPERKREKKEIKSLDRFQRVPLLSAVDTSNDVPITPPLYAATVWHFHRTFAPPREHDVTP